MKTGTNFYRYFVVILLLTVVIAGSSGCKARRLAEEQARIEAMKVETAKADLETLLNNNTLTANELQTRLDEIKSRGINNNEVNVLISQVEQKIEKLREEEQKAYEAEQIRLAEVARLAKMEETKVVMQTYLTTIASGNLQTANATITSALQLFASPEVPVLIVISESNGVKDYDRPTNIKDYLNFVKDQKRFDKINKVEYDANGKITFLEMRK